MADSETSVQARVVAGRYQLVRELGRGGMGTVWLADDQLVGRQVAVKELRPPPGLTATAQATFTQRALTEARNAARIHHPGAVTLHDITPATGTDPAIYLIMEYLDGPTLAQLIHTNGAQPAATIATWGLQLLAVLDTAHTQGIIHRDIKPANIIITNGQATLTDFGIAHTTGDPRLTHTGILGTQAYLAPELFDNAPPSPATDLWSLGATLYAAATGTSPFDRDTTTATLRAILIDNLPTPPGPPPLAAAITGLLQRNPTHRATTTQTRTHLNQLTQPTTPHQPTPTATPDPAPDTPTPWEQAATTHSPAPQRVIPSGEQAQFEWTPQWKRAGKLFGAGSKTRKAVAAGAKMGVLVFSWGIRVNDHEGETSIRWEEITELRKTIIQQNIHSTYQMHYTYRLQLADGQSKVFGGMLGERLDRPSRATKLVVTPGVTTPVTVEQVGRLLDAGVARVQIPRAFELFNAGQTISFGPLMLSQKGITAGDKMLPWAEVKEVKTLNGSVFIKKAGKRLPWTAPSIGKIPNYSVFDALVRAVLAQGRGGRTDG
jgi:serine/threonine protein kinase